VGTALETDDESVITDVVGETVTVGTEEKVLGMVTVVGPKVGGKEIVPGRLVIGIVEKVEKWSQSLKLR